MVMLNGKPIFGGRGEGLALVTKMPMNFTAAFTKLANLLPHKRSTIQDRHHDLYKKSVKGRVLVFPAAIGSTYTGMVLLQRMYEKAAPAAMIVQRADSLLVSGTVLAEVWFGRGVPVVEYAGDDLLDKIKTGDRVSVDGQTGKICIVPG